MKKYDFISHITYPVDEKIDEIFFKQHPKVPIDIAFRDGFEVDRGLFDNKTRKFLLDHNYTVKRIHVIADTKHLSITNLPLTCENTDCIYFDEMFRNKCNIKVKACYETIKKTADGRERQILVSVKARDMNETVQKVNCVIDYVEEQTGIEGNPDTYSKTNLC